ncbi:MAG: hypothetical protein ACHQ17_02640 [Polyangia bacterium]|jgi:hypothetical protein
MRRSAQAARIICFRCRKSDCGCVADHTRASPLPAWLGDSARAQVLWLVAWILGACLAGSALGALLALLVGS